MKRHTKFLLSIGLIFALNIFCSPIARGQVNPPGAKNRKAQKIKLKKLKLKANKNLFVGEPVLIQEYFSRESADAIPIDQIILCPNKEIPVLMLPAGSFRIRAIDKSGKVIGEYKVS